MSRAPMTPQASLDLTHVLYDDSSLFSLFLALVTLSPILLMAAYAALAVQTREFIVIAMWAGQLACEAFNLVLKRAIKQGRPSYSTANGYGFPSSHSQYMGYFAAFLMCHLYFRHRFSSTGIGWLDRAWRIAIYAGLAGWTGAVAYSRYKLTYHSAPQILWGLGIGVSLGVLLYIVAEVIPARRPSSLCGRLRVFLLDNPVSVWLQIRDGWTVWADGGREDEWRRWRAEWEKRRAFAKIRSD